MDGEPEALTMDAEEIEAAPASMMKIRGRCTAKAWSRMAFTVADLPEPVGPRISKWAFFLRSSRFRGSKVRSSERLGRLAQQRSRPGVGGVPGRRSSRDTRCHTERGSLEPRDRPGAAVLYDAQAPTERALQDEVIAEHAAEGTGDGGQVRCRTAARPTGLTDGAGAVARCRHGAQSATRWRRLDV